MRKLILLFAVLLVQVLSYGQARTISGTVTDESGNPVSGASVKIKDSRKGVAAGEDGRFLLTAKTGDVIEVTGAGLSPTSITVGSANQYSIIVKRVILENMEVVVTALGQARAPKELGYSVARVKGAEINQAKAINLQNGLTGKVSGLNVQTINNGVFADTRLTLRGIRSLTGNNQPMLIVDGFPVALGYLNSINPNDIQDVSVLKSTASTAIYGPDGANGALVVTTKRGSKAKPLISASHTVQLETVSYMPKLQTQFGSGSSVDAFGYGVYDPIENQGYGDPFDGSIRQIGRDGPNGEKYLTEYIARPEEKRKFWNTGITNQTDVSFSTGDFYLSAQNVLVQGIMPKDVNRRTTVHLSANKELGKFKASYNINYTRGNFDVTAGSLYGNNRDFNVYWNLINTPMHIPVTRFKDWRNDHFSNPNGYFSDYYSNPYFMIDNFRNVGKTEDLFGNIELGYKVNNWMNITYRLGATVTSGVNKSRAGAFTYSPFAKGSGKNIAQGGDIVAQVNDATNNTSRINSEVFVTTKFTVGDFKIDGLLGQSFREDFTKNVNIGSNNLAFPELFNVIGRKGEPGVNETSFKSRLARYFGKVSLNYKNWAFAEATASYDINSRLAYYYDYDFSAIGFFYPGVSTSVVLTEAITALKESKTISYLKLRGALSKTGNVNLGVQALENTYGLGGGFPYGSLVGYTSNNVIRLSRYTPEFVKNREVGFELGLFKNRVNLEATYYSQDNSDQIVQVAYSGTTGFTNALLNAASFTNKGMELDLKLTPLIKARNLSVDFKVNYTYQSNKVSSIIEGVDELGIGNGNFVIVGQPAYTFKLTDYIRDDQGRVIVDAVTGMPTQDPVTKKFGHTAPNHLLGMNLSVNWKNFTLSAVADYRGGAQIFTGILGANMDFTGISKRSGQNNRQPFIFPNSSYWDGAKYVDNNSIYTISGGYNFWSQQINTNVQSNYLVSADFWKIREISLSYNIPSRILAFTNGAVKNASFTLSGRNLFMFLPKSNEWTDPEFSNNLGNAQGVADLDNTPPTRIFGATLSLQF